MTPEQIALARRVLKLKYSTEASRNRLSLRDNSPDRQIWINMVKTGDAAEIHKSGPHGPDNYMVYYYAVTKHGALQVIQPGETLPEEIFDTEWAPIIDDDGFAIARTDRGRHRSIKGVHFDKFMHAVYELVTTEDRLTLLLGYRQCSNWRYWAETGVIPTMASATLDGLLINHRATHKQTKQDVPNKLQEPGGAEQKGQPAPAPTHTIPTVIVQSPPALFTGPVPPKQHIESQVPPTHVPPTVVMIKPGERYAALKAILDATGFEFTALAL